VSFIGLVANVLVVTLIPLAMLLSFVAGLAGMLVTPIAGWFARPARALLTYMLDVANLLSRIPYVFVQQLGLSVAGMLLLYGVIVMMTRALWRRNDKNYAIITDRNELNA
jgi:competence protein ComEC